MTPPVHGSADWIIARGIYDSVHHGVIFRFLRERMARQFARNNTASFRRYLRASYTQEELKNKCSASGELEKDLSSGRDAISRARGSSFWEWDKGSTPCFWRWQPEVGKDNRDGTTKLYVRGTLPNFRKPQTLPKEASITDKVMAKVNKVNKVMPASLYIAIRLVLSLSSFFTVSKGDEDIRIVYHLTACGLNEALWAPSFWMPTINNVLDCACASSWFGDVDAAEMFLCYILDEMMISLMVVDPFKGRSAIYLILNSSDFLYI